MKQNTPNEKNQKPTRLQQSKITRYFGGVGTSLNAIIIDDDDQQQNGKLQQQLQTDKNQLKYNPIMDQLHQKYKSTNNDNAVVQQNSQNCTSNNMKIAKNDIVQLPHLYKRTWQHIVGKLQQGKHGEIQNTQQFVSIIQEFISIEQQMAMNKVNMQLLNDFFQKMPAKQMQAFIKTVMPWMFSLALEIETLFKTPLHLLKQHKNQSVMLSKKQVACLVVHQFLCTIRQPKNFAKMFRDDGSDRELLAKANVKINKITCFYNYFRRCQESLDDSLFIEYVRSSIQSTLVQNDQQNSLKSLSFWSGSKVTLRKVFVLDVGTIEDQDSDIQIDFANKKIGGGCLTGGSVQEEIRFCVSPELLPSILLFDDLDDNEAAFIIGAERFTSYSGYSRGFEFGQDFIDKIPIDLFNRKDVTVCAIDAQNYNVKPYTQYMQYNGNELMRELVKAYIGFQGCDKIVEDVTVRKKISTGRWGCGAFGGDSQLKFLIQWIAASQAERNMKFFRFEDKELKKLETLIKKCQLTFTVGSLFQAILTYCKSRNSIKNSSASFNNSDIQIKGVFDFIFEFQDKNNSIQTKQ